MHAGEVGCDAVLGVNPPTHGRSHKRVRKGFVADTKRKHKRELRAIPNPCPRHRPRTLRHRGKRVLANPGDEDAADGAYE